MEVGFKQKAEDYMKAVHYVQSSAIQNSAFKYLPFFSIFIPMTFIVVGVMFVYRSAETYPYWKTEYAFWLILVGFILLFILLIVRSKISHRYLFLNDGVTLTTQHFSIESDFLVQRVKNSVTKIAWSDVLKIEENGTFIFVFIDAAVAVFIPYSAFSSSNEANEFLLLLNEKTTGKREQINKSTVQTGTPKAIKIFVSILVFLAVALTLFNKINGH